MFTSSNSHLAECRRRSENPATDRLVPVAQKINKQAKKGGEGNPMRGGRKRSTEGGMKSMGINSKITRSNTPIEDHRHRSHSERCSNFRPKGN